MQSYLFRGEFIYNPVTMHESNTLKLRFSLSNILASQAWFQIEWSGHSALGYPV